MEKEKKQLVFYNKTAVHTHSSQEKRKRKNMGELIEKKEIKKKIPPMQISQEPLFQHITY